MRRLLGFWRTHKLLAWVLVGFAVSGACALRKQPTAAQDILGFIAGVSVIVLFRQAWADWRSGLRGLNLIAPVAVIFAVSLRQEWVAVSLLLARTLSGLFEETVLRRTTREQRALAANEPQAAHVLHGRKLSDAPAGSVNPGNKFVVNPDELVPADAVIVSGASIFNETILTGSTTAQQCGVGDQVLAGSVNAGERPVTARALCSAQDSQRQQLIQLARSAAATRAPFVQLAGKYALLFAVIAAVIGGVAWIISRQPVRFLEVLVVATPTALIAAAPAALVAGLGRAVREGSIFRTSAVLEQLSSLQTVIFGKQPALTGAMQGKLKLGLKQLRGLGVQHALLLDASDGSANRLGFTDTVHAGTTGDALRAFETAADRPVAFISRDATEVPLLAAADIGILLPARGQRAVAASADILVMQDDPAKFAEVTALAHHTVRVATQGIAAGTGLSIALMLLFAVTKLPLLAGVGAQFLVDIIVLGNALRAHQSPRRERAVTEAD